MTSTAEITADVIPKRSFKVRIAPARPPLKRFEDGLIYHAPVARTGGVLDPLPGARPRDRRAPVHLGPVVEAASEARGLVQELVRGDADGAVAGLAQVLGQRRHRAGNARLVRRSAREARQPAPGGAVPGEGLSRVARLDARGAAGEHGRHRHRGLVEGGEEVLEDLAAGRERIDVRGLNLGAVGREVIAPQRVHHDQHDVLRGRWPARSASHHGQAGEEKRTAEE